MVRRTGEKGSLVVSTPAAAAPAGEAAAAGGVMDITAGWIGQLYRPNMDPVLASKGGGLEIYEELLRDHTVATAFQQRQLALIGKPLEVIPGGTDAASKAAAEHLRAQLDAIPWDTITAGMLYGRIYGYAVGEAMWGLGDDGLVKLDKLKVRKARRFSFGPDEELLLRTRARPYGEPLPPSKFWVYSSNGDSSDDPYGFGLGQILYWLVWFKRNDLKLWLQALDKHAAPTAIGEFAPGTPKDERDRLLAALASIRNSSAITVPAGFAVRLLEAAKSGGADYAAAHEMLEHAITRVIIGQTMTSFDGSSRAQGEVHQDVLTSIVKADDDLLSDSFNQGPAVWLTEWNFPGAKPPKIRRRVEPPEDLGEQIEIDTKVSALGFEPDEKYIKDTYGPHWKRKEPAPPPAIPGKPPALNDDAAPEGVAANFAELLNQDDSIEELAAALAAESNDLAELMYASVVDFLERQPDIATARERLAQLLPAMPKDALIQRVGSATFQARLAGLLGLPMTDREAGGV